MDERKSSINANIDWDLEYIDRKSMIPEREVVMEEIKTNELVEAQVEAQVVLLVIGEVFSRMCNFSGCETLFACDKELFFIAKQGKLILGNREQIVNCNAKGVDPKTCGVIKDFKLSYNRLHKMEMKPMSFKSSVHLAAEWLGLPL